MSAKISRPTLAGEVQRERLFHLLDKKTVKPVTWLCAPGGSGKSTLVASYLDARKLPCLWYQCDEGDADLATFFYYMGLAAKKVAPRYRKPLPLLTPEYLAGIPTFTRRYFEILYRRCQTIVFDNYQDVPADSPFHDMLASGFDLLPEGVHAIVISRTEPPPSLARLQAHDRISLFHYNDICFTREEERELVKRRLPLLDETSIASMHERTAGWAAGIILILEHGRFDGRIAESTNERVFDYFAGEIFNKAEKTVQEFLLKTALLPIINVALAEKLSGIDSSGRILATLNRQHFFTERLAGRGQSYQYHPLFRDFLLNRLSSTYPSVQLAVLQRMAALLLEESGNVDDAAQLFCRAQDREGLSRMIIRHARTLLMQGRNKTIAEWIECLPEGVVQSSPWLLYWSGMSSFPMDIPRSRNCFEKSFDLFKSKADPVGVYLAWVGIVDTYGFALDEWRRLDEWIEVFETLEKKFPVLPTGEIDLLVSSRMLMALTLRRIDQSQMVQEWRDRVTFLLQENPSFAIQIDIVFFMSVYHLWKGEYGKNALLLEQAEAEFEERKPTPFAVIRIKLMLGIHYWVTAQYDAALKTLSAGLEISKESGVHIYDSLLWGFRASAEMAQGKLALAGNLLQRERSSLLGIGKSLDLYFFHINSAWHALLTGNPSLSIEHLELISAKVEKMGTPYYRALWNVGMAQALFQQQRDTEAKSYLQGVQQISREMQSPVVEWYGLLIDAYFLLRKGKETEGLLSLRNGLALGRQHGYVHLQFYQPTVMQLLLARALTAGIEPEYVRGLIRKLKLSPPDLENSASELFYLDHWPWPVRITTLGRFEIRLDDEPLLFSGKEQKKPLELLKALIALGGRNVAEERLTDLLWPEADGDQAHKALETTLGRLRRLLGRDEALRYRGRQLSINPEICSVDSLALDTLLQQSRTLAAAPPGARAIALYQGPFLPGDHAPWVVTRREALKNGLLRLLLQRGRHFEAAGDWESAVETYAMGIETEPLAEEFYRRSIDCQRRGGNHAEAATTYQRCCRVLLSELGIVPSPETTAVFAAIRQNP